MAVFIVLWSCLFTTKLRSVIRLNLGHSIYKDIIWLLNDNSIIPKEVLGDKAEANFPNFDGPKWKGRNRISARIRKKFDGNRDILLKNQGKFFKKHISTITSV